MTDAETNEKLAGTLNWLVANGHVPGIIPESVTEAARRLVAQGERIRELEAALSANKHTATVDIVDSPTPYSKEVRLRVDVVDPRPYFAVHCVEEYRLLEGSPDYLHHVARSSLRMVSKVFEETLMPQAMAALQRAYKAIATPAAPPCNTPPKDV